MYTENPMEALAHRRRIADETNAWITSLRQVRDAERASYFTPDHTSAEAYEASAGKYRADLIEMLGYPLTAYASFPAPAGEECERVAEDEYGVIERLWVEVLPGLFSYGLFFTPRGEGKFPLAVALHGGLGTPELAASFYKDSANYNHLVNRIRAAGRVAVYAPQLVLWGDELVDDGAYRNGELSYDAKLKQLGSSSAALEIFKILRTVDHLTATRAVDAAHIGIAGLSYGGYYTLFTAAVDTRFRAALSSCFFNDRYAFPWADMTHFGSAAKLLDPEVAALVCPRALCIQVGERDPLFLVEGARERAPAVAAHYGAIGLSHRFRFSAFPGVHEFSRDEGDVAWFVSRLTED